MSLSRRPLCGALRYIFIPALAGAFLTGCHPKPPSCNDEATLAQVRSTLLTHVQEAVAQLPFGAEAINKPGFQHFLDDLSITLSDITSDGYQADAKKYTCQVRVTVRASNRKGQLSRSIHYSTQATEDGSSHPWLLQLSDDSELANKMAQPVLSAALKAAATSPNEAADHSSTEDIYLAQQAAHEADGNGIATRFGKLSVSSDNQLLFNGKPTVPAIQGNSSLSILDKKIVGDQDIVLIQNNGGAGCPATYHFVQLVQSGIVVSKEFGTCSDVYKLEQRGNTLTVTLPGFLGPFESEQKRLAASKKIYHYVLENGTLTENGKPLQ